MKILFYSHFFYPEAGAGSIRIQYFVRTLQTTENEIKVITPYPNYPSRKAYQDYKKKQNNSEFEETRYLYIYVPKRHSILMRGFSYLSYFISSFFFTLFWNFNPEIVITSSPPISTALAAALFCRIKRKKMILDLRDMWPEIGIQLGLLTNKPVIKLLKWFEKFILNSSTSIIVTANGDKDNLIKKGVLKDSIHVIFNGADTDLFKPLESVEVKKIRENYGIPLDKKVLIYFGSFNYGMNDLIVLGDALIKLEEYKDEYVFVAVGDGNNRETLMSKISPYVNCLYLGTLDSLSMAKIIAASDISLIPRKGLKQDTGGNTPVKCFESWAAGVPVILSANPDSEIANIFNESKAGILTEPDNADSFSKGIQSLLNRNDLKEIGLSGRKYVEMNYNRNIEAKKLNFIVVKLNDHVAN